MFRFNLSIPAEEMVRWVGNCVEVSNIAIRVKIIHPQVSGRGLFWPFGSVDGTSVSRSASPEAVRSSLIRLGTYSQLPGLAVEIKIEENNGTKHGH